MRNHCAIITPTASNYAAEIGETEMNTYRINYQWKENNNAVNQSIQSCFELRKDCKTPSEAAKKFYDSWESKKNGFKITSIEVMFGEGETFFPVKHAKKNWK